MLLADSLIAVFLAVLGVGAGEEPWLMSLLENFIYSHAIGTSIFVLVYGSGIPYARNNLGKLLGLTGLFVLGGWWGTIITLVSLHFLFGRALTWSVFTSHLLLTGVLAFVFGAAVYSFFAVRERLQDTIAALADKEVKEQQLLRLKTKAELEALRAKVNPHFLFNTLNSIASLIPTDPNKAEEMVQRLARLFRYTLEASNREVIKLEDELRFCREYLEIEKVRLGARLQYEINSDPALAAMLLPGLLLQPLIENSVKHGIASAKNGGQITLNARREQEVCHVEIIDTGKGFDHAEITEGFGLSSVRERLALHYGEAAKFELETNNGVRIRMQLPFTMPENAAPLKRDPV
ncbi:MAG: histidine kinase [candidate division KSB1 bacterium]